MGSETPFLQLIRRAERGRHKIYLGYCPGVGKTCRMLEEGHRLRAEGIDVVVGLVETHGREGTTRLAEGLPTIASRVVDYKDIRLEEMDLDAILERHPQVVLVDELAHTNVPGSRNGKRWEDVEELLSAGIHVVTTVNIQHLESLYDTVGSLVGVRVRERLPDSVILEADEVVNVDLSEEDLLQRLREGRIYPGERVPQALANYFQTARLERLRELALRELAQRLDRRRREVHPEEDAPTGLSDLVMVGISGKSGSERLLRHASRLAGRLARDWYAVHVEPEDVLSEDARERRELSDTLTLAGRLGATVFRLKGHDVAGTLLSFAREYGVGYVVVGRPLLRPWWRRLFRPSVAEDLVRRAHGFTVDVADVTVPDSANAAPAARALEDFEQLLPSMAVQLWNRPVTREEVVDSLVRNCIEGDDPLRMWEALEAVREREAQGSTFLPDGIAIPHGRLGNLQAPRCAIGVAREGISDAPAGLPVDLVFLLLTPKENPKLHLKLMSAGTRFLRDRELRRRLLMAEGPESAREILTTWWASSHGPNRTSQEKPKP